MPQPERKNKLPSYKLYLFARTLHPELFDILNRRHVEEEQYSLEAWLTPNGHVIQCHCGQVCATEAVLHDPNFTERHYKRSTICQGEREVELAIRHTIGYISSIQTEQLSGHLFQSTFDELSDFAKTNNATTQLIETPEGKQFSILDVQRYQTEVHTQCYHLIEASGFILRTQAIFELLPPTPTPSA